MTNKIAEQLSKTYEELDYMTFYREIFNDQIGHQELAAYGEKEKGMYCPIAKCITFLNEPVMIKEKDGRERKQTSYSYTWNIFDGLDELEKVHEFANKPLDDNEKGRLTIISPCTYIGKRRLNDNVRNLYALCVEVDHICYKEGVYTGLSSLFGMISTGALPRPTYIIASGSGIHLYYKFDTPICCFPNVKEELAKYKERLTRMLWSQYITDKFEMDQIQFESVFQGFRMVGTPTKFDTECQAFRCGEEVTIDYMNSFVPEECKISLAYKNDLSKARAQELYPDWYQNRVIEGKAKGHWVCKRAVYDWWLKRANEGVYGHRYYCVFMLVVYAIKCQIDYEELETDAYNLMHSLNKNPEYPFTADDIESALGNYYSKGDNAFTYPIHFISRKTGIKIEPNKRNYRKQSDHIKYMNFARDVLNNNITWNKIGNGRKPVTEVVKLWKLEHPNGTKKQCKEDTGLTYPTIRKWWDYWEKSENSSNDDCMKHKKKSKWDIFVEQCPAGYLPVDYGDGEYVYMTNDDIDTINHKNWHKTLPEHYVIEGELNMASKMLELVQNGARSVEILTQEEFEYLNRKESKL